MISINATLFVQAIHFLILTFILNYLLFRPILKLIRDRSEHVKDVQVEIEGIELKTQDLINEYLSRNEDARSDAGKERARLKDDATTKADELFRDARNKVASIRMELDKEVAQEVEKIRPSLQAEASTLVNEIVEKVVGRRIAV